MYWLARFCGLNTLRPRQDGRYFADDVLKCIFLNENVWISLKIPLKFVPRGPINNIRVLVQIMAWCRPGDKPLSEPMMVCLLTHICVTRPQWVNSNGYICLFEGTANGLSNKNHRVTCSENHPWVQKSSLPSFVNWLGHCPNSSPKFDGTISEMF